MRLLPLFPALLLTLFLSGCFHAPAQPPASPPVGGGSATTTSTTEVDTSDDWQYYDEIKEGIKRGVLSGFKYPKDWYTFNISGGNNVAIYFSDGGDLIIDQFDNQDIIADLYYQHIKQETNDECKYGVVYNGDSRRYRAERFNTKFDMQAKGQCDEILNFFDKQSNDLIDIDQ